MEKLFILLISIFIAGCVSGGLEDKFSVSYIKSHVIENKTTKSEIQSIYGVPDEQFAVGGSSNYSSWVYRKGDRYKSLDVLSGYIPSVDGVISAVGIAQNNVEKVTSASNKVSGNTEKSGSTLSFGFDDKNVVTQWELH